MYGGVRVYPGKSKERRDHFLAHLGHNFFLNYSIIFFSNTGDDLFPAAATVENNSARTHPPNYARDGKK